MVKKKTAWNSTEPPFKLSRTVLCMCLLTEGSIFLPQNQNLVFLGQRIKVLWLIVCDGNLSLSVKFPISQLREMSTYAEDKCAVRGMKGKVNSIWKIFWRCLYIQRCVTFYHCIHHLVGVAYNLVNLLHIHPVFVSSHKWKTKSKSVNIYCIF